MGFFLFFPLLKFEGIHGKISGPTIMINIENTHTWLAIVGR